MKSSNKTTLEYLNILNDRGIGAVGMLANAYGVDQGEVYSMISKGQIAGQDAARIIPGRSHGFLCRFHGAPVQDLQRHHLHH